jgi:phospholipase C
MEHIRGFVVLLTLASAFTASADGDVRKVQHVLILMQENHSFDNYFGALPYAPGSPYHAAGGPCRESDHSCIDGLSCRRDASGELRCANHNPDLGGASVRAFHLENRCVRPDLDHSWVGTHREMNYSAPNQTLHGPADGFVRVNDETEQHDVVEGPFEDETIGFYTQAEIPFYYDLASKFAIDDRYFSSVLAQTFPNRSYLLAATSFGHLTTNDIFPPPGGYKPITGTIFDLLEAHDVTWADYFQDAPQGAIFRAFSATQIDPHFFPLPILLAQLAGAPGTPPLAQVSFVDPNFGLFARVGENDEHPPTDIQRGQAFVSNVVNALRNGPHWKDSVLFLVYDEHGGFYDHVTPPAAAQPDGIAPGQCADLSNPPASEQPGGGAECSYNFVNPTDTSVSEAIALCPALAADPTGPFPRRCANFDQLGVRVPFVAISPFSKPHYVSHTVGDHASLLAFIERAFLPGGAHLTRRDLEADPLEDVFDFDAAPSLGTPVSSAAPPANDCTPP